MFETYWHAASLLITAWLLGGMLFFSATFAAFLFKHLPPTDARLLIRKAFPGFYLFVIVSAALTALLCGASDAWSAAMMAAVALTALAARQMLMPAINRATDQGQKTRFACLHGFSVVLTLAHMVLAAAVLLRLAD